MHKSACAFACVRAREEGRGGDVSVNALLCSLGSGDVLHCVRIDWTSVTVTLILLKGLFA